MEENNGMMDLITHYMNERSIFPSMPQHQPSHDLHYAMVMLGGGGASGSGGISLGSDSTMAMGSTTSGLSGDSGGGGGGLDVEIGGYGGRWSKEETLVLLEIRSRLDSKFKEANHKGPLWDEISRSTFFLLYVFLVLDPEFWVFLIINQHGYTLVLVQSIQDKIRLIIYRTLNPRILKIKLPHLITFIYSFLFAVLMYKNERCVPLS